VCDSGTVTYISIKGEPKAVLLSRENYESILETLNVLSDDSLLSQIRSAELDISKDDTFTLDAFKKELGL
jgi:antitoxin YefM